MTMALRYELNHFMVYSLTWRNMIKVDACCEHIHQILFFLLLDSKERYVMYINIIFQNIYGYSSLSVTNSKFKNRKMRFCATF